MTRHSRSWAAAAIVGMMVVHLNGVAPIRDAAAHPESNPVNGIHPHLTAEQFVDHVAHGPGVLNAASPRASGDLNADGLANVVDLLRLRDLVLAGTESATLIEVAGGDLNGNGVLDASDVAILESLLLGANAPTATRTSSSSQTGPTFNSVPMTLATFDTNESWTGGTVDQTTFREGDAGLKLTAIANRMQYASRDQFFDASDTPWEMTLWVHTDTPTTIGRLVFLVRSGDGIVYDHVSWAGSGFKQGWNQLVIPSDAFFQHYYSINNFSWATARTMALKLEANGNGIASVTLDDFQIEPTSPIDRRPPVMARVNITHVSATSVTVNWTTQEPATGVLNYGPTTDYGTLHAAQTSQTFQKVTLNDLTPATRYHCRIDATDINDLNGSSGDFVFTTAPALDLVPPDPSVNYELGLYAVNDVSYVAALEGSPFTSMSSFYHTTCTVSLVEAQAYLDQAQASGIKVMMGLGCNPIDDRQSIRIINAFKYHPAVGSWFLSDEPEGHGITQEYLATTYAMVKQADPFHDFVISSFGYGSAGYPYTEGFDRVDFVAMPVPFRTVDSVIPKLEEARAVGGAWYYVYQAYQPDVDRWIGSGGGPTRYPTEAEMRALAFLGVNHGATGLTTYGHNAVNDMAGSEWHWTEVQSVTQGLYYLRPLFASTETPQVAASSGASALDLGVRRYQGRDYIIAVNSSANAVSASLSLTGATGTSVQKLDNGQSVAFTAGLVADSWNPFEVHVYAATPLDADAVPPTLSILDPVAQNPVGGSTTVTIDAADDMLIDHVQVFVDGVPVGAPLTTAPYTMTWDAGGLTDGTHILSAIAYDASGNSAAVEISLSVDNVLPTVALDQPAEGSLLQGQVALAATAADDDEIVGVQFEIDGLPVGAEDTVAPYESNWDCTTASDSSHSVTAVARDRAGNIATSASVSVIVDNTAPVVNVTAAEGSRVRGQVVLAAIATDADEIAGVQFNIDGLPIGAEDTVAPYESNWDCTTANEGSHSVTAVARDRAGHIATSASVNVIVDNTAPAVNVTTAGESLLRGQVALAATATDNDEIAGVQFLIDGLPVGAEDTVAPYESNWDCTTVNDGSHSVTAVARDRAGHIATSASVSVIVDNTAPVVNVTAPANGANLKGTNFSVTASASDGHGVTGVQFVVDGANFGARDTSSPYSITWTSPADGSHTLTAVATDAVGNATTSPAIQVIVDNTAPLAPASVRDGPGTDVQFTNIKTALTANWNAAVDPASGVAYYQMAIGTTAGGTQVRSFANVGNVTSHTWTNLNLNNNTKYYVSIRAVDRVGNIGAVRSSDGITVDTTNPTVSITAPNGGTTVSGTVTISASASDNRGIANVQFRVDGVNLGAPDTTAPYSIAWNTTTFPTGNRNLTAVATDVSGNTTTSSKVTARVRR